MKPESDPNSLSWNAFYTMSVLNPSSDRVNILIKKQVDWSSVSLISLNTGTPYILFQNLKHFGLDHHLDPNVRGKLIQAQRNAFYRNLGLLHRLHEFMSKMEEENIKIVLLKGLSLITDTYSDIVQRTSGDMDILIDPRDFKKCLAVLEKLHYKSSISIKKGVMMNPGQEVLMIGPQGIELDIHYRFFSWYEEKYIFKIESKYCFENALEKVWKGRRISYLRKEDEFCYLLMCFFKDHYRHYRYLVDADAVAKIHGSKMDWDRVRSQLEKRSFIGHWKFLTEFMRVQFNNSFINSLWTSERPRSTQKSFNIIDKSILRTEVSNKRHQLLQLIMTETIRGKISLALIYFKWQMFKYFGFWKSYFLEHHHPNYSY